ncbi:MAG: hypothetical protein V4436_03500, partial [Patescibacteria group bacterium]
MESQPRDEANVLTYEQPPVSKDATPAIQNVVIVGLGYVGLPLALLSARRGFNVVGIDTNLSKIEKINAHESPFKDDRLAEEFADTTLR